MRLGNLPPHGDELKLGKWYVWFHFRMYPPSMVAYRCLLFKPQIFFGVLKVIDFGEPQTLYGRARKEVGFWKRWTLPFGFSVSFEIIR